MSPGRVSDTYFCYIAWRMHGTRAGVILIFLALYPVVYMSAHILSFAVKMRTCPVDCVKSLRTRNRVFSTQSSRHYYGAKLGSISALNVHPVTEIKFNSSGCVLRRYHTFSSPNSMKSVFDKSIVVPGVIQYIATPCSLFRWLR